MKICTTQISHYEYGVCMHACMYISCVCTRMHRVYVLCMCVCAGAVCKCTYHIVSVHGKCVGLHVCMMYTHVSSLVPLAQNEKGSDEKGGTIVS